MLYGTADMTVVAGNKLKNGAVKFAEFSKQMVAEFGEKVRPKLPELYQESFEKFSTVFKS